MLDKGAFLACNTDVLKREYEKAKLNPDKPIELSSESDKLSFEKIVDSVIDLIKLPDRPFTFGFFGKWGVGKSTILGELQRRLDHNGYYVVTFDAWKYEKDALRRSFLVSIATQLNKKTRSNSLPLMPDTNVLSDRFIKELNEDIYTDRTEPQKKVSFSWWRLALSILFVAAVFISLVILEFDKAEKSKFIKLSPIVLALVFGIATFIVSALKPSSIGKLLVKQISVGTDKLSSPEEFYAKFLEILEEIKGTTLLIIIDNLDRTQKEATVKLLGTIKTFLNSDRGNEDVIFLIASDHKAIKRHIKEVYSTNPDDAYESEEFIKKFFNAVIEIPPFISSEYREYLIELLNQSGIKMLVDQKEDLISIISAGYPDNPRGSKHFVNSLVVYLLMLSSIGDNAGIEQEFIEKNLGFIATMLVIRDRFDEVYDDIQEQSLKYEHSWEEIKAKMPDYYSEDPEHQEQYPETKRRDFVILYNSIESWVTPAGDSIKWFFNMRRSTEEQRLPNWDAFLSSVEKKDQDQALKYLSEFTQTQPDTLNTLLQTHISNVKSETSRWTSFNTVFIAFLTSISDQSTIEVLKDAIKATFRHFPTGNEFAKFVNQIDCQRLIGLLAEDFIVSAERTRVRTAINGYLRSKNVEEKNLLELIQAELDSDSVNATTVSAIGEAVESSQSLHESSQVLIALVRLDQKHEFINSRLMEKVLQSIAAADLEKDDMLTAKLDFVNQSRYVNKVAADKYVEVMNWLQNTGNPTNRPRHTLQLYRFISMADDIAVIMDAQSIQNITQYLYAWYQQTPDDFSVTQNYIPAAFLLSEVPTNSIAGNGRNIVQNFFERAPSENLLSVLGQLETTDENRQLILPKLYARILNDANLFDSLSKVLPGWFTDEYLANLGTYLLSNVTSLNDESNFRNAISLCKQLVDERKIDTNTFEEKLYEALNAKVTDLKSVVSSYVYKRNDNLLANHPDWLKDLKRKLR